MLCSTDCSSRSPPATSTPIAEIFHDEIQVWHNVTDRAVDKRAALAIMRWYVRTVAERRYEIVERRHWPGGVMQRHILHGRVGDAELHAPVCITFEVRDGQIIAIHEYVDSAAIAAMMPPPERRDVLGLASPARKIRSRRDCAAGKLRLVTTRGPVKVVLPITVPGTPTCQRSITLARPPPRSVRGRSTASSRRSTTPGST